MYDDIMDGVGARSAVGVRRSIEDTYKRSENGGGVFTMHVM